MGRSFFRLKITNIAVVVAVAIVRAILRLGFLHTDVEIKLLFAGGILFLAALIGNHNYGFPPDNQ